MNILFIHQNFPGQFPAISRALAREGHRVLALATASTARDVPGVELVRYPVQPPEPATRHPWLTDFEAKVARAEACGLAMAKLPSTHGFRPDLIIGHPGWGELLATKDVYPEVPVLYHQEFFYRLQGTDSGFDPEFANPGWKAGTRLRLKRAPQLLALQDFDWGVAPTWWQWSTVPGPYRDRIRVIHEGIDTDIAQPNDKAFLTLPKRDLRLQKGDEFISFISRTLEPSRGFHIFLRAMVDLQRRRPNLRAIIIGRTEGGYGAEPPGGGTWKDAMYRELGDQLDLSRLHFVNLIPHKTLHQILQTTACHVYLTYPFVLSWSLLEAMACGAPIVASRTPPVQEVIRDGVTGRLVDFFDVTGLADRIEEAVTHPERFEPMRRAARQHVIDHYDQKGVCLPAWLNLVHQVAAGETPPPQDVPGEFQPFLLPP